MGKYTENIIFQKQKKNIKMLLLMEKKLFNQPIKMIWEHIVTIQRLQLVKEIIIQLAVY